MRQDRWQTRIILAWLLVGCWLLSSERARALPVTEADAAHDFVEGNRLYEQGKYADAAAAYGRVVKLLPRSASGYFNLGNAWFKSGQRGRALAAYLRAEQLAPRDPNVRFNLDFIRRQVTGNEVQAEAAWRRALLALSLNEWALLGSVAWWIYLGLLTCREWNPMWRRALVGYTASAGVLAIGLGAAAVGAITVRSASNTAVTIAAEAVVRNGPLDESPVAFKLRDGAEAQVVDRIESPDADKKQVWIKVLDVAGRPGWVKLEQVLIVPGRG